ncbi:TenA family protein [Rothia sp. HC945]|uniref:TenA family protein n=1 Tax=Rothia sp. HC945 TaxID=3171170 RepID=UPI003F28BE1E
MNQIAEDKTGPWRTGEFTSRLWNDASGILDRVNRLAFLEELAAGTLAPEIFVDYIQQDTFYLGNYSRALAMLATRAPSQEAAEFWAGSASAAVADEKALHAQLMADRRLSALPRPEAPSPTTRGYMYTLLAACAYEPYDVGAAAVLPCFWIYADVGQRLSLRAETVEDPPYGRWIEEYGDPAFAEATQRAIDLVDEAAESASDTVRSRMREVFLDASRYEEMFWDAAYRREKWSL